MRHRVLAMGAHLQTPRTYEDNSVSTRRPSAWRGRDCLLRLRRDRRNRLTYKEPTAPRDAEFKIRHEYEVEVKDFAQMRPPP